MSIRYRSLFLVACWLAFCGLTSASPCPGDLDADCHVTVDEIMTAVDAALHECPGCIPSQSTLLVTGQIQCDQGSGALGECPGSPAEQDGDVGAGRSLSYTDSGDGTIRDDATGLVWEKLSNDGGLHDLDDTYTWRDAFDVKIAALNMPPCLEGHCDWRLPNRRELDSLVDLTRIAPAIAPAFDKECKAGCVVTACSCTQLDNYWSSTSDKTFTGYAFAVNFNAGYVNGFDKTLSFHVRAVRGGI